MLALTSDNLASLVAVGLASLVAVGLASLVVMECSLSPLTIWLRW